MSNAQAADNLKRLEEVVWKNKRKFDVPEAFLCRITDELFKDPVVLSSGFSYEREAIQKHF
jgi:hypothetical protein